MGDMTPSNRSVVVSAATLAASMIVGAASGIYLYKQLVVNNNKESHKEKKKKKEKEEKCDSNSNNNNFKLCDDDDESKSGKAFSTRGQLYDSKFLKTIEPLYDLHMGCENMGPMLYQIVRFIKPNSILEVGAGLTSIYLCQALHDNQKELNHVLAATTTTTKTRISNNDDNDNDDLSSRIFLKQKHQQQREERLVVMDNMEHESTTAHLVESITQTLKVDHLLQVVEADCFHYTFPSSDNNNNTFDLIWLDGITADERFPKLVQNYWNNHLTNGGYLIVHSTCTNVTTTQWMAGWVADMEQKQQTTASMTLVKLEIKPLDPESTDLKDLAQRLQIQNLPSTAPITVEEWHLDEIGFGIQKLCVTIQTTIADHDLVQDLEARFQDEIASIDVVEVIPSTNNNPNHLHRISFLEPHKRYQNSFTIFQKREGSFQNPIYSWGP